MIHSLPLLSGRRTAPGSQATRATAWTRSCTPTKPNADVDRFLERDHLLTNSAKLAYVGGLSRATAFSTSRTPTARRQSRCSTTRACISARRSGEAEPRRPSQGEARDVLSSNPYPREKHKMNRRSTLCLAAFLSGLVAVLVPALSRATPTGRSGEIAFSAHVRGVSQVFTVNPDGTRSRQITHSPLPVGEYGLSWSPDGRSVLYTVTGTHFDFIIRSSADGSSASTISPPCTGTCLGDDNPAYSPDGKRIAFARASGQSSMVMPRSSAIFTDERRREPPDATHREDHADQYGRQPTAMVTRRQEDRVLAFQYDRLAGATRARSRS